MEIEKYINYLQKLDSYIEKCFLAQKPYIFCKEGCSICCETGLYPISSLEFEYMLIGYRSLSAELKAQVQKNIKNEKIRQSSIDNEKNFYQCPFLINKSCCIYQHRGLICRSYGLLIFNDKPDAKSQFLSPCCCSMGLNYSMVYDEKNKKISYSKMEKMAANVEPLAYNLSYTSLKSNNLSADINFGDCKALIDWFDDDET